LKANALTPFGWYIVLLIVTITAAAVLGFSVL
jgi:hypothetical protein